MELYLSFYRNHPVHWGVDQNKNEEEMKVGDIVRGAYDRDKYRTGIVLRIARQQPYDKWGACAEVLWSTTPMGLSQRGAAWLRELEVINETR